VTKGRIGLLEYLMLGNRITARTTTKAPRMEVGAHASQIIAIADCTLAATTISTTSRHDYAYIN